MLTFATSRTADGEPVLACTGEIDLTNAVNFEEALANAVAQTPTDVKLVLDMSAVTYMSSAGISVIHRQSDRIRLVVSPLLKPIIELCGLDQLIKTEESPR